MIQVTCGACGAVQELSEGDVPASRTISCASCKSKIAVPGRSPGARSAALPDLPAPRRPSPLAGASAGASKTAAKSPLAAATDLPAPKAGAGAGGGGGGAGLADLPAPKAAIPAIPPVRPPPVADLPVPRAAARDAALDSGDLPMPKRAVPSAAAPATPASAPPTPAADSGLDLVAPKRPATPLPAGTATRAGIGAPPPRPGVRDIELDDLLAPTGKPRGPAGDDLPAPRARGPGSADVDLPAPRRAPDGELPAPVKPRPADLPAPRAAGPAATPTPPTPASPGAELPAPKGFFDDLPQPAKGGTGLPAPKGFFEDLPQPAKGGTGLPAPKGFFDDIPQPARSGPGLPAPKGFFDDIPQPALSHQQPAATEPDPQVLPTPPGRGANAPVRGTVTGPPPAVGQATAPNVRGQPRQHPTSAPPPTADDLFSDLTPPPVMTTPPALDLDDLDLGPSDGVPGEGGRARPGRGSSGPVRRESASGGTSVAAPLPRADGSTGKSGPIPRAGASTGKPGVQAPMLDLGDGGDDFAGVDLPPTSTAAALPPQTNLGISFKPAARPPGESARDALNLSSPAGAPDLALDTETKPARRAKRTSAKPRRARATERPAPSGRRTRVFLLVTLLVLGAAAGGFYFWRHWQAKQDRDAEITQKLGEARAAMLAPDAKHWQRAQSAASTVVELDGKHAEAAGIAAQAAYASAIDEGIQADARAKQGAAILTRAGTNALVGPEIDKAQALKSIVDGQPERALQRLEPLAKRLPNDGNVALYLGWAKLAARDFPGAVEAFDRSAKALPKRDLPAIFGRAQAKLGQGDLAAARADFALVLERSKEHLGAQVGLAAAAPATEFARREADLMALLTTRKDLDKQDQRAVAAGWTLAGDDALRANRFDAARERYRKAQQRAPLAVEPILGQAQLELRAGKPDVAAEAIDKALKLAADDVPANLLAVEIDLARGKAPEVEKRLDALGKRKITNPVEKSRMFILIGKHRETIPGKELDALAAYEDAIAVAPEGDVAAPVAAATWLGKLAEKAPAKASEYRAKADKLLEPLAQRAKSDPHVAVALGVGYLAAGNPARGETWLRQAMAARPDDIEAHFQLAEALNRQNKRDEALAILRKAYELDPARLDVGLELARSYEAANRDDDAGAMYDQLLAGKEVSIDLRGRAGRFFARTEKNEKARAQGEEILKVDAKHPAGLFLKGVGLYVDGKLELARRAFQEAVDGDPDPQYLDSLGRANEGIAKNTGDARYKDEALRVYTAASKGDPNLFNPLAGQGRILIERRDARRALDPLTAAIKLRPNDPDVQYGLGLANHLLGKPQEAIGWMAKSAATAPRSDKFLNLGRLHYDLNQLKEAAAAYTRATQLGATDERGGAQVPWLTEAYYTLGRIESDRNNDAGARRAWQSYLDRNPQDQVKVDQVQREMLRFR